MVFFIPKNVNKFKIPNTKHFIKGGKCETFRGVNVVVYWWWMQGNGAWKYSGGDANILMLNFYVFPAWSSQLSVISKLCIMNTLLHFLLLCQSCHCLRSVSSAWPKCLSRLGEYDDVIRGAPILVLPRAPPTLNPPLRVHHQGERCRTITNTPLEKW